MLPIRPHRYGTNLGGYGHNTLHGECCDCGKGPNDPNHIIERVPLSVLRSAPTITFGQADDLKIDDGKHRVWLSRCTVEDGEPYNNKVTVERLENGRWVEVDQYQAR